MKFRSIIFLLLAALAPCGAFGQELFVFTEPSSNMPAKSIGLRASNLLMKEELTGNINYHLIPEVMWGVNKRLMLHLEGYFSNRNNGFSAEGGGFYAKYRFLSHDAVYKHFRAALFGRITMNNADIHQEEIQTNGHNSGFQSGLIATQLLHKWAFSATAYYEQAWNNGGGHEFPGANAARAVNYTLSLGRLVLPEVYTDYKQTNMNIMVELLGQSLPDNGKRYLDLAPSIQFIFNSQTRLDIGYRRQLYSNMVRTAPNGMLIRVEHLLFNVL